MNENKKNCEYCGKLCVPDKKFCCSPKCAKKLKGALS